MHSTWNKTLLGLIKATHFGPTVLVVTITFFLARSQYSISGSARVAFAILAGQCVVGWTNDLIDFPLDAAAGRSQKPLVTGVITCKQLKVAISTAFILALLLSLMSPLGVIGTLVHEFALLSATAYNFQLKKTLLSVLPYVISFGALPWAIYLSAGKHPPLWLYLGFILFSSSFHFLNVLKDLEMDLSQGINGLPQRLGKKLSIASAAILAIVGIAFTVIR